MREMSQETLIRFIGICMSIFLFFGLPYGILVATRPFRPRLTWLSVVFGDLATDLGMAGLLLLLTEDLFIASIPFLCHALTGGPMIAGQILKHALQNGDHIIIEDDDDGDPA